MSLEMRLLSLHFLFASPWEKGVIQLQPRGRESRPKGHWDYEMGGRWVSGLGTPSHGKEMNTRLT